MPPDFDWRRIDTVLLDMDGTLLDLNFDNHFWQEHVPQRYAEARGLSHAAARDELATRYRCHAGTLEWYSVDFWQESLQLDIMRLKEEVAHLIAVHPEVIGFLAALRTSGKRVVLATNAHHKSLSLKMARTGLAGYFDEMITSHETGYPKEAAEFWAALRARTGFDPATTLLVDDSLPVLDAAQAYGIARLICVRQPDTRRPPNETGGYQAIDSFAEILPTR